MVSLEVNLMRENIVSSANLKMKTKQTSCKQIKENNPSPLGLKSSLMLD